MTTKLEKTIRREIEIDGEPFTVAISPDGIRLTRKRFRSGRAVSWRAFLRGELGRWEGEGEGVTGDPAASGRPTPDDS